MRKDGRKNNELRPLKITGSYLKYPEGSVLIELGESKVICTASVKERVPPFLHGTKQGWVTAEYAMLPRSTDTRLDRERGSANARSLEIQRLIGRSLRSVVNLAELGEITIVLDCDVIQADGGTRTAAISGAFVALSEALYKLKRSGELKKLPVNDYLAAVSVGLLNEDPLLDLDFEEDFKAAVDMNIVMTSSGRLVEVQGSAEGSPFTREQLDRMLDLAAEGVDKITAVQRSVLGAEINGLIETSAREV